MKDGDKIIMEGCFFEEFEPMIEKKDEEKSNTTPVRSEPVMQEVIDGKSEILANWPQQKTPIQRKPNLLSPLEPTLADIGHLLLVGYRWLNHFALSWSQRIDNNGRIDFYQITMSMIPQQWENDQPEPECESSCPEDCRLRSMITFLTMLTRIYHSIGDEDGDNNKNKDAKLINTRMILPSKLVLKRLVATIRYLETQHGRLQNKAWKTDKVYYKRYDNSICSRNSFSNSSSGVSKKIQTTDDIENKAELCDNTPLSNYIPLPPNCLTPTEDGSSLKFDESLRKDSGCQFSSLIIDQIAALPEPKESVGASHIFLDPYTPWGDSVCMGDDEGSLPISKEALKQLAQDEQDLLLQDVAEIVDCCPIHELYQDEYYTTKETIKTSAKNYVISYFIGISRMTDQQNHPNLRSEANKLIEKLNAQVWDMDQENKAFQTKVDHGVEQLNSYVRDLASKEHELKRIRERFVDVRKENFDLRSQIQHYENLIERFRDLSFNQTTQLLEQYMPGSLKKYNELRANNSFSEQELFEALPYDVKKSLGEVNSLVEFAADALDIWRGHNVNNGSNSSRVNVTRPVPHATSYQNCAFDEDPFQGLRDGLGCSNPNGGQRVASSCISIASSIRPISNNHNNVNNSSSAISNGVSNKPRRVSSWSTNGSCISDYNHHESANLANSLQLKIAMQQKKIERLRQLVESHIDVEEELKLMVEEERTWGAMGWHVLLSTCSDLFSLVWFEKGSSGKVQRGLRKLLGLHGIDDSDRDQQLQLFKDALSRLWKVYDMPEGTGRIHPDVIGYFTRDLGDFKTCLNEPKAVGSSKSIRNVFGTAWKSISSAYWNTRGVALDGTDKYRLTGHPFRKQEKNNLGTSGVSECSRPSTPNGINSLRCLSFSELVTNDVSLETSATYTLSTSDTMIGENKDDIIVHQAEESVLSQALSISKGSNKLEVEEEFKRSATPLRCGNGGTRLGTDPTNLNEVFDQVTVTMQTRASCKTSSERFSSSSYEHNDVVCNDDNVVQSAMNSNLIPTQKTTDITIQV